MIEINLLPEERRVNARQSSGTQDLWWYLVPFALGALVLIHLIAGLLQFSRSLQVKALNQRVAILEPQRRQIESFTQDQNDPSKKVLDLFASRAVSWSQKLNILSFNLPAGVWFSEITVNSRELFIRGSVFSLEKNELDLINRFMSSLRSSKEFMSNFNSLDLGPLQSKTIGSYEVFDFTVTASLNSPS